MVLKNDLFIRALKQQSVTRTPIWLMRQAGRYLPEYRQLRQEAGSFMQLCQTPDLACEVTLQPLRRFDLDAAIIFSDILTIPDAMGLGLHFIENEGPKFEHPITCAADIHKLPVPDPTESLNYVLQAMQKTRKALDGRVPLIGFSGSPWTLATYMVEGGSSKTFQKIKTWLYQDAKSIHQLLDKLSQSVADYLNAQIAAGAQAVMVFDTWGGILSPHGYQAFSLQYMQRIIESLQPDPSGQQVPCVLFTKNGGHWLSDIIETGCDGVGIDWTQDLAKLRPLAEGKVALQGNLDPLALFGSKASIAAEVQRIKQAMQDYPGFVFNLGHGILPATPIEHVSHLIDCVHQSL